MGKNATLNPMNITQKLALPSGSESNRPVTLGYQ